MTVQKPLSDKKILLDELLPGDFGKSAYNILPRISPAPKPEFFGFYMNIDENGIIIASTSFIMQQLEKKHVGIDGIRCTAEHFNGKWLIATGVGGNVTGTITEKVIGNITKKSMTFDVIYMPRNGIIDTHFSVEKLYFPDYPYVYGHTENVGITKKIVVVAEYSPRFKSESITTLLRNYSI